MPRDLWWIYDEDAEGELVAKAMKMAGFRMCAACYAADAKQHSHREGKGDMKGLHLTLEELD